MDRALLEMEYAGEGNRHTLRLHVLPVNPTPVGPLLDLYYGTPPLTAGAEVSVLDTFEAFGVLWAPYYPDTWTLTLIAVWAQDGASLAVLPGLPTGPAISATVVPTGAPLHSTHRVFTLNGGQPGRRRLHLAQVNAGEVGPARGVTPAAGGYDTRDQDLIAYLSSGITAAVDPAGAPFAPVAVVKSTHDRPTT